MAIVSRLIVTQVKKNSQAEAVGLFEDDAIIAVGDHAVTDNTSLGDALRQIQGSAVLHVERDGKKIQIAIKSGPLGILSEVRTVEVKNAPYETFVVIGGSGWDFAIYESVLLTIEERRLTLQPASGGKITVIPFESLMTIEAYGPGSVSTNAGVIGGGFGLDGAALGILAASVINAVTTRTTTNTFLRLATRQAEVFLHTAEIEPNQLRMKLSAAVVCVEAARLPHQAPSLSAEIQALHGLLKEGILTDQEFQAAKAKLLA